jgi:aspartyl-tRNA synthetase
MKDRILIKDLKDHVGQEVSIYGWISNRRDHGKLIFLDVRDRTAFVQVVVLPAKIKEQEILNDVKYEWVVKITGAVQERPANATTEDANGKFEMLLSNIEVLGKADVLPFDPLSKEDINEEIRLKYRYLDLRSPRLQKNLRKRSEVMTYVRNAMVEEGFCEIDTPILAASTPEGSRDFLVPSRIKPHSFYALPQSPQQFKQLLMVGGFERYFQFARCMRDEDLRGDRQPEFTQMDLEMSFVDREDVMALNEKVLIKTVEALYPEKHITQLPFPRITHKEAMEKYGNDKPDIRKDKNDSNELGFCWVIDFPLFEKDEESGKLTFSHNPFAACQPEYMDDLMNEKDLLDIISTQYDVILNGNELGGGSVRAHKPEVLFKIFQILGYSDENINTNFGHMIQAFKFGVPPHGGIAWGFDRFIMLLQNEPNIRETIAFPKNGKGEDVMTGAPSIVPEKNLKEVGIQYYDDPKKVKNK